MHFVYKVVKRYTSIYENNICIHLAFLLYMWAANICLVQLYVCLHAYLLRHVWKCMVLLHTNAPPNKASCPQLWAAEEPISISPRLIKPCKK